MLLRTPEIFLDDTPPNSTKLYATVGFYVAFDPGHGIGILTDGNRILGFGNQYDAVPFAKSELEHAIKRWRKMRRPQLEAA